MVARRRVRHALATPSPQDEAFTTRSETRMAEARLRLDVFTAHAGKRLGQERDTACCRRDGSLAGASNIGRMLRARSCGVNASFRMASQAYGRGARGPSVGDDHDNDAGAVRAGSSASTPTVGLLVFQKRVVFQTRV
jgi:hypothetical protein